MDQALRDRLRQQDYGHRFSPREGWSSKKKKKSSDIFDNVTSIKVTTLFISSESLHEEQLVQQQRDAQRNLRAEASMLAAQTSTQLHAQSRVMEHHTSTEQDEFYRNQMQEFAIQAEETIDAQRQLYFQEAGEELPRNEDGPGSLVNHLESRSQNQSLESSTRDRIRKASIAKPRTVSVA